MLLFGLYTTKIQSIWDSKSESEVSKNNELTSTEWRTRDLPHSYATDALLALNLRKSPIPLFYIHFTKSSIAVSCVSMCLFAFVLRAFLCFRCAAHVMVFVSFVFICTKNHMIMVWTIGSNIDQIQVLKLLFIIH